MLHSSKRTDNIQAEGIQGDDLIRQDVFACNCVYCDDSSAALYSHRSLEIGIVVNGYGIHKILGQAIPCKTGDVYILNSNVPHRYFSVNDSEELTVRRLLFYPKDWLMGAFAQENSTKFCYGVFSETSVSASAILTRRTLEKINSMCDAIMAEQSEKKSEWHSAVQSYLSLILITLERYINRTIKNIPKTDITTWNTVSAVIALMNENYGDPNMTLEYIAGSFYISKSHLSRLFKRVTGETFSEHLRKIRLSAACSLLADTDMTVEEIVKACGMRDVTSFYNSFSRHTGLTPNQYRKKHYKGDPETNILTDISENLQKGRAASVKELVQQAIDEGYQLSEILEDGLLNGMSIVGEKFKNNEIFVPEVLVATRAMNMGVSLLKPLLVTEGVASAGKVCIGTVQGDLHDIGKNLAKMMMEGKGLEVIDLGTDVAPETFVNTAIEQGCQVICCSALLTTTISVMADVVKAAEKAGIRDKVKIMIGGAPVSEAYCREIGADCYREDATSGAETALELCKQVLASGEHL